MSINNGTSTVTSAQKEYKVYFTLPPKNNVSTFLDDKNYIERVPLFNTPCGSLKKKQYLCIGHLIRQKYFIYNLDTYQIFKGTATGFQQIALKACSASEGRY